VEDRRILKIAAIKKIETKVARYAKKLAKPRGKNAFNVELKKKFNN
jgi:hypothetical protein